MKSLLYTPHEVRKKINGLREDERVKKIEKKISEIMYLIASGKVTIEQEKGGEPKWAEDMTNNALKIREYVIRNYLDRREKLRLTKINNLERDLHDSTDFATKLDKRRMDIARQITLATIDYCTNQYRIMDEAFSGEVTAPLFHAKSLIECIFSKVEKEVQKDNSK